MAVGISFKRCGMCVVSLVVFALVVYMSSLGHMPTSIRSTIEVSTLRRTKIFAYLTQTESCLYEYLRSPQQLGDPNNCQCDILVVSFKEKCNDSSLPHVEYIFAPNTTWTTGRNLLYRAIMKRKLRYLYYTFFDDDITLTFKQNPQDRGNPWREYEMALLQFSPPVAVSWEYGSNHFNKYYRGECNYTNKIDFLPYVWYDALFNSFHSDVVDHLLPYYEKMEKTSIWYSQLYLIVKSDLMFPGQVFHHVGVIANNLQHRPYARKYYNSDTVRAFLDDLKNEIPVKYQEQLEPRLQDWVKNVLQKQSFKYHCPLSPEVRKPVIPYHYLDVAA